MSGAAALAFPGSRTLASWWRQLAPYQPLRLWVGHLIVHRVEALALVRKPQTVDALNGLLLGALDLAQKRGRRDGQDLVGDVDAQLGLGRSLVVQALRRLEADGLVANGAAGWSLTPRGQEARHGQYAAWLWERRTFCFAEREDRAGHAAALLHFLSLHPLTAAWSPSEAKAFDPGCLRDAARRSDEWKTRFGFPPDVADIVTDPRDPPPAASHLIPPYEWQCVPVDRPARGLVVLSEDAGGSLLGFAARQQGWHLSAEAPIFRIAAGREVFPTLPEPTREQGQAACRAWGQQKGLGDATGGAVEVDPAHGRMLLKSVDLPEAVRKELRKGETWLLIGEGLLRAAVRLELSQHHEPEA
jgi:hypothetical protein